MRIRFSLRGLGFSELLGSWAWGGSSGSVIASLGHAVPVISGIKNEFSGYITIAIGLISQLYGLRLKPWSYASKQKTKTPIPRPEGTQLGLVHHVFHNLVNI